MLPYFVVEPASNDWTSPSAVRAFLGTRSKTVVSAITRKSVKGSCKFKAILNDDTEDSTALVTTLRQMHPKNHNIATLRSKSMIHEENLRSFRVPEYMFDRLAKKSLVKQGAYREIHLPPFTTSLPASLTSHRDCGASTRRSCVERFTSSPRKVYLGVGSFGKCVP
jgi:hypothetical protein